MSGIVYQTWEGGHQTYTKDAKSTQETELIYEGDDDVNAAAAAFFAWLPNTVPDMFSGSGHLILEKFGPVNRIAKGTFTAQAHYVDPDGDGGSGGKSDPPKLGEFKIEYDTSPEKQKITFGEKNQWTSYRDPAYAEQNEFGGIGVKIHDGKCSVEGVDVYIPSLKFSILYRVPRATFRSPQARIMRNGSCKKNDATFLGWKRGELLFLGGTASQAVFGDPEIKLDFLTDIEVTKTYGNINNGNPITKPPHDYLDLLFNTEADDGNKVIRPKPVAAYVHKIYGFMPFPTLFGFGP